MGERGTFSTNWIPDQEVLNLLSNIFNNAGLTHSTDRANQYISGVVSGGYAYEEGHIVEGAFSSIGESEMKVFDGVAVCVLCEAGPKNFEFVDGKICEIVEEPKFIEVDKLGLKKEDLLEYYQEIRRVNAFLDGINIISDGGVYSYRLNNLQSRLESILGLHG